MHNFWRKLLAPESLFFIGFVQAIFPYLLWQSDWGMSLVGGYSFDISYQPLFLWMSAYLAFWIGCKSVNLSSIFWSKKSIDYSQSSFYIKPVPLRLLLSLILLALGIQVLMAVQVLGVVPILAFASGGYDVDLVNQQQLSGSFGQFGVLLLSNITLSALILSGLVTRNKLNLIDRILLVIAIIFVVFVSVFQGKRQGLFMFSALLFSGLALVKGRILSPISEQIFSIKLSKKQTAFAGVIVISFFVFVMGFISSLRLGSIKEYSFRKNFDEICFYLSLPLVNLHSEVYAAGVQGFQFNPKGLLYEALPYRIREQYEASYLAYPMPKAERSSGAGFIGSVHWEVGLVGMLAFCCLVGAMCKYVYVMSTSNFFFLLVYCQAVWALVAAHSYNHFLTLIYFYVPVVVYFFLSKVLVQRTVGQS